MRAVHSCNSWFIEIETEITKYSGVWSGSAKVLCKLSEPGRPSNLDNSRTRAYCD